VAFRAFFGQDLLALVPVNSEGELDPARLGGFAFAGWCYDWLLRNIMPAYTHFAQTVPISALLFLWTMDMVSGVAKAYKTRTAGTPWWDGAKARHGLGRLVWLWLPLVSCTYALRESHVAGASTFASVFDLYALSALALSCVSNLATVSGARGLRRIAQDGLDKLDREGDK